MFRTLVKTEALAVEDRTVAVRYFELRTLRGARRYSAGMQRGRGDRSTTPPPARGWGTRRKSGVSDGVGRSPGPARSHQFGIELRR